MICSLFEGEFLGFLCRSVRAMGCFFGCFRIKDDHRPQTHLVSEPVPSKAREPVVSRNRLSSLLLSEVEERDGPPCKDKENIVLGILQPDIDDRELKDEAKFLKACGTLPETPVEIRKASVKLKESSPRDGDCKHLKFHSWLPNTSIEKLDLDKLPHQPPTPIKICEEWVKGSVSSEHTPSSSISNEQHTGRISTSSTGGSGVGSVSTAAKVHADQTCNTITSSVSARPLNANVQYRSKSVRFECESDTTSFSSKSSSSEFASQNSKQYESAGNYSVSKPSPYPTPLKLTDEMQTPGTVFPAYLENMTNGKNPRIRSQYVYSVLNPVENFSQWKEMKEEDTNSHPLSGHLRESFEQVNATPKAEVGMRQTSVEKELKVEASLSSWLKPQPSNQDGSNQRFDSVSSENARFGRTPGDRPIIGMVAAHWNEDQPSRVLPKWWDGNGIPNSTNKYKEDQKVSWHATPFEERLEKALSEDTSISQRKHINGTPPVDFDENEESDTALSQLQSSTHLKPVVSF
uniref:Protein JASON n=1 Tax=Davidia involucrata TaxID=16924 RepID=A0A5B7BDI4_DAVIN